MPGSLDRTYLPVWLLMTRCCASTALLRSLKGRQKSCLCGLRYLSHARCTCCMSYTAHLLVLPSVQILHTPKVQHLRWHLGNNSSILVGPPILNAICLSICLSVSTLDECCSLRIGTQRIRDTMDSAIAGKLMSCWRIGLPGASGDYLSAWHLSVYLQACLSVSASTGDCMWLNVSLLQVPVMTASCLIAPLVAKHKKACTMR